MSKGNLRVVWFCVNIIETALKYLLYIEEKCLGLWRVCIMGGNVAISLHLNEKKISIYCTEPLRVTFLITHKAIQTMQQMFKTKPISYPPKAKPKIVLNMFLAAQVIGSRAVSCYS